MAIFLSKKPHTSPLLNSPGASYKMDLSRQTNNLIHLLATLPLLMANVAFADLVFPSNLLNKRGSSTPQPLEVLAAKDQRGSDDDPDSYIKFDADESGYSGIFRFNLPAASHKTIQKLIFHASYRGPEKSFQTWEFDLLNVKTGKWTPIADNAGATDAQWSDVIATVTDQDQFINTQNQINLRYMTKNGGSESRLDFLALDLGSSQQAVAMAASGSGTRPTPAPVAAQQGNRWHPSPGLKWQIQYTGTLDTSLNVDVYNLDLFDTSPAVISALRSKGKHVICYFSAGSYESWRPDAGAFPAFVLGRNLDGWMGERWLDLRQAHILLPIMKARMTLAAHKGCHAVDPDNVDGYSNNTGFHLTYHDQLIYNHALADAAHSLGLAIGLKNNLDQIKDLGSYFDFAVNEECFQNDECDLLKPFVDAGKAVFGIEYALSNSSFCPQANEMHFDFLKKTLALDAWRQSCK